MVAVARFHLTQGCEMNAVKKAADYLGRYGEILATMYMMHQGYFVTQLGNANKNHDLLCEDADGKIISVQVKTSSNSPQGQFTFQLFKAVGISGKCHGSTTISSSNLFIFFCYMKESGNFYIYKFTNKYLKDLNTQCLTLNISDLHKDHLFITKKLPDFSDDSDEDFKSEIPLLWDLIPLVQVNSSIEAA